METTTGTTDVSPNPPATPDPVRKMLREFMEKATRDELAGIAIAFIQKDGAAAVQSTGMTAVNMNHLLMLFNRKVSRMYDRALAAAEQPRSPTGAVTAQSPTSPAAQLPRKIRRQVAAAQKKVLKKSLKRKGLAGPPLPPEA
jgi:hypothetical protein